MKTNTKMSLIGFFLLTFVALFGSGCATATRTVTGIPFTLINANVPNTQLSVDGQPIGVAPQKIKLSPRREYTITAQAPGCEPQTKMSVPQMDVFGGSTFFLGNTAWLAISPPVGIVGYGVDFLSKDYKAHAKEINFDMLPYGGRQQVNYYAQMPPPPRTAYQPEPQPPQVVQVPVRVEVQPTITQPVVQAQPKAVYIPHEGLPTMSNP